MIALARRHMPGLARFLAAGFLSMALILAVLALLQAAGLDPRAAYAGALASSLLVNFFVNRRFVFPAASAACPRRQARRYVAASLGFRLAEWSVFAAIFGLAGVPPMLLAFIVQAGSALLKYAVFDRIVFAAPR